MYFIDHHSTPDTVLMQTSRKFNTKLTTKIFVCKQKLTSNPIVFVSKPRDNNKSIET